MTERRMLAQRFDAQRGRLRAVAYQLLGSGSDAEDAVQEAWLRLDRTDPGTIDNLDAWLTTVISRISLDLLRTRQRRRETPWLVEPWESTAQSEIGNPEREAAANDAVSVALLVVLETLSPPERLAFVLHDVFGQPFAEIAEVLGRSEDAARQLASRARRRVRGAPAPTPADRRSSRKVVDAWLAATTRGDFTALLSLLDDDVVLRADFGRERSQIISGARNVAEQAKGFARIAANAVPVLLGGRPGVAAVVAERVVSLMAFEITDGRITALDVLSDPDRMAELDLTGVF